MSNQQSSIASSRNCSTDPTLLTSNEKIKKKKRNLHKQQQQSPRSRRGPLLQDYLNIPISSVPRTNSNSSSLSCSSSISIESPRGCFNFFSKTPRNRPKPKFLSNKSKSSPNPKENRQPHNSKKTLQCLSQSSERISCKTAPKVETFPDFENHHEVEEKCYSGEDFNFPGFLNTSTSDNLVVEDCNPAGKLVSSGFVRKSAIGNYDCKSVGEKSNSSGTPPVQSTLSPEIQCRSSVLDSGATTSTSNCYGAGHVLSGITNRRKCTPRGSLIVGSTCSSGCPDLDKYVFDGINDGDCIGVVRTSRPSFIPLPSEASMSWNLSPSQEDEGGSMKGERVISGSYESRNVVSSATLHVPSLPCQFDSNMFRYTNHSNTSNSDIESGRKTRITLLSPTASLKFQGFSGTSPEKVARPPSPSSCATPILKREERTSSQYNFTAETFPFSLDSLSSGNVIQNPKSDSIQERHVGISWLYEEHDEKENLEYELNSVSELHQASLSPQNQTSPSKSINFSQLQKNCIGSSSCSTFGDVSESPMRISWRDGLVSRIFEMDDLDPCSLLSDEENEGDGYENYLLKQHPTSIFTFEAQNDDGQFSIDSLTSPKVLEHGVVVDRKRKALLSPNQSNSRAESICTDRGGLVVSGEADWTLCYKNHLFQV